MAGQRGTLFLLLVMVAWVAAAFAGAVAAIGVLAITPLVLRVTLGFAAVPLPNPILFVLIGASGFQATLLLAALRLGRRTGDGDRRAGLGIGPIHRGGTVLLLCAAMVASLAAIVALSHAFPALREYAKSITPEVLSASGDTGIAALLLRLGLIAVLAPLAEELFFRGWFWEALRRHGHTVTVTAALTVLPWLLLHGIDAPGRMLFLLPAATILSLARHWGGGVLASLVVHVTNNVTAVSVQAVAALFGNA